MKILFVAFILFWICCGISGVANCKKDRVNYEMIAFLVVVPFIPLIAKFFNLF